jgi:hypothetical protein
MLQLTEGQPAASPAVFLGFIFPSGPAAGEIRKTSAVWGTKSRDRSPATGYSEQSNEELDYAFRG